MILEKYTNKQYDCKYKNLTEGVAVTQLPSNAEISV
jgi:hypothetical protein